MTNVYYVEKSGKDINDVVAAMLAGTLVGAITSVDQIIMVKPTIFLICYTV